MHTLKERESSERKSVEGDRQNNSTWLILFERPVRYVGDDDQQEMESGNLKLEIKLRLDIYMEIISKYVLVRSKCVVLFT